MGAFETNYNENNNTFLNPSKNRENKTVEQQQSNIILDILDYFETGLTSEERYSNVTKAAHELLNAILESNPLLCRNIHIKWNEANLSELFSVAEIADAFHELGATPNENLGYEGNLTLLENMIKEADTKTSHPVIENSVQQASNIFSSVIPGGGLILLGANVLGYHPAIRRIKDKLTYALIKKISQVVSDKPDLQEHFIKVALVSLKMNMPELEASINGGNLLKNNLPEAA